VFTIDGQGDGICTAVWRAEDSGIAPLQKLSRRAAIGWAYGIVTEGLGWWHGDGEGKTMGLAPYGDARKCAGVLDKYFPNISIRSVTPGRLGNGYYWPDGGVFHSHFDEATDIQALINTYSAKNLAAEAQRKLENCVVPYVHEWIEATGIKRTAYAGGVFLNVKLNQRIWTSTRGRVLEQHIFPNPGDGGLALGAALYAYYTERPFAGAPLSNIYWGPEYGDRYIEDLLNLRKIPYEVVADPSTRAAEMLADGLIVGWFQGRMESGPRALGNRSILMAPTPAQNKDRINAMVKFRESFRPFCPSILWEERAKYLLDARDEHFMITSFDVNPSYRGNLAAVVHVDGTVRPQMVTREMNDRFWSLIKNFGERTGIFAVLNTSMNVKGEPIVNTPSEAVRLFFDSGLDAIFLGRLLVRKTGCGC
jgi:carbamoyltransferase